MLTFRKYRKLASRKRHDNKLPILLANYVIWSAAPTILGVTQADLYTTQTINLLFFAN